MAASKRSRDEPEAPLDAASPSEDGSEIGPELPPGAAAPPKKKKRKTLAFEKLYVDALPRSNRYSKSLMHKVPLAFVTWTPKSQFLITASVDGQVSFWKKTSELGETEFVKHFHAHQGDVLGVAVSWDGNNFASVGEDGKINMWDVKNVDIYSIITPPPEKKPQCICWVGGTRGHPLMLAVGNEKDGSIQFYDSEGASREPTMVMPERHKKPVTLMSYNRKYDCVVSVDNVGMVEYWEPHAPWDYPEGVFKMKSDTNLYEFRKKKVVPGTITMSPTGDEWVALSHPDRMIRVFDFRTGKLKRAYDESIDTLTAMHRDGKAVMKLDNVDFGRRLAVESSLDADPTVRRSMNVIYDESGHFILYGSLYGIKVLNTTTNRVVKVYGGQEGFRPLHLSLYQDRPMKYNDVTTLDMATSNNPLLLEAESREAILATTGANKVRFYFFTNIHEDSHVYPSLPEYVDLADPYHSISKSTRDVQNEQPRPLTSRAPAVVEKAAPPSIEAILHTTLGDIHLRLYASTAPKTVENFTGLSKAGAYNGCLFHRVIRKFMVQTGDFENGDGTGGKSIWGGEFDDELGGGLKFDQAYTLAMANAGPGTNASQFFITTEKTPWLDGKHTIFGRVTKGTDVVHRIENVRTYKEKPEEDIKIVSVTLEP